MNYLQVDCLYISMHGKMIKLPKKKERKNIFQSLFISEASKTTLIKSIINIHSVDICWDE